VPVSFTPAADRYARQQCNGVNVVVLDRTRLDTPELGIELASALHRLYPSEYKLDNIIGLLVNEPVFRAIVNGEDPRRIEQNYRDEVEQFEVVRKKYLLY